MTIYRSIENGIAVVYRMTINSVQLISLPMHTLLATETPFLRLTFIARSDRLWKEGDKGHD